MTSAEDTVRHIINGLLDRRDGAAPEVHPTSRLFDDLDMDSLEVAELSAALEDELGTDPFSEGQLPDTVGKLVDFYRS